MNPEKGLESPDNATRHESPRSLSLPHLRSVERRSLPGLPVQSEFKTPERNESCFQSKIALQTKMTIQDLCQVEVLNISVQLSRHVLHEVQSQGKIAYRVGVELGAHGECKASQLNEESKPQAVVFARSQTVQQVWGTKFRR